MSTPEKSNLVPPNIVVIGDVNLDTLIVPIPRTEPALAKDGAKEPAPEPIKRYRRFMRDGGALLLSKAIKAAVNGLWKWDLRLMRSVSDVKDIPTEGKNLILVAAVGHALHFRIFGGDGKVVVDTDEKSLTGQAQQIEDLRKQLESLWAPHEPPRKLTRSEEARVIAVVTSVVGHIGAAVYSYDRRDKEYIYQREKKELGPDELFLKQDSGCRCRESLTTLALFPKKRSKEKESVYKEKDSVYRIAEVVGWVDDGKGNLGAGEVDCLKGWLGKLKSDLKLVEPARSTDSARTGDTTQPADDYAAEFHDPDRPRIVVINDRDHGFRELELEDSLAPFLPSTPRGSGQRGAKSTPYAIVLEVEFRSRRVKNKLWDEIRKHHKDHTVVVVSVESLREAGISIRDDASIEQLAQEFLAHLVPPPPPNRPSLLAELAECRHLIVWFRDGAIHHDNRRRGMVTDYFCPYGAGGPGSTRLGSMAGYTTILVASIVRGLACSMGGGLNTVGVDRDLTEGAGGDDLDGVKAGIGLGVVLCRQHFAKGMAPVGFLTEGHANFWPNPHPFEQIFIDYDGRPEGADKDQVELFLSRLDFGRPDSLDQNLHDLTHRKLGRVRRLLELREAQYKQSSLDAALEVVKGGLKRVVEVPEAELTKRPDFPPGGSCAPTASSA
jgi:hypothetical protein